MINVAIVFEPNLGCCANSTFCVDIKKSPNKTYYCTSGAW